MRVPAAIRRRTERVKKKEKNHGESVRAKVVASGWTGGFKAQSVCVPKVQYYSRVQYH